MTVRWQFDNNYDIPITVFTILCHDSEVGIINQ